jgi:hypothetical protein
MQVLGRREKRRSDIYSLLERNSPARSTVSAPVSPLPPNLSGVREERTARTPSPLGDIIIDPDTESETPFGFAALDLQRKRMASGLETFMGGASSGQTSPRYGPSPTISSASRFTRMQTSRHPLSLSALHHAVQGALASKRYACAHLLALRFSSSGEDRNGAFTETESDGESDEGYWEDVKSVMGLLTTTLADAAERLTEALESGERVRLRDENPSEPHSRSESVIAATPAVSENKRKSLTMAQMVEALSTTTAVTAATSSTFAPMPSHLTRFAAHVDAISTALNDAREHLEQCVASLHDRPSCPTPPSPSSSPTHHLLQLPAPQDSPALQAYERLRRELGLALRECERGRERLLDIVAPRHQHHQRATTTSDEVADQDDLPALGHDVGSDESDKQDSTSPFISDHSFDEDPLGLGLSLGPGLGPSVVSDDATTHLLLTASSQHLPPQGIEQVFEADTGNGVLFSRERSKLTREERIRLAKARRESADPLPSRMEQWGPGGEVVQELKDVIWKVGERRRKMADGNSIPDMDGIPPDHL